MAFIRSAVAVGPDPAELTITRVLVHTVHALSVNAWIRWTLVDIWNIAHKTRDVTRPQPHEAEAEAEATTHEAEAEAEATTHEAEAEAEATTHEAEAEAEAKTHLSRFLLLLPFLTNILIDN